MKILAVLLCLLLFGCATAPKANHCPKAVITVTQP